jgi:hypothetical protein
VHADAPWTVEVERLLPKSSAQKILEMKTFPQFELGDNIRTPGGYISGQVGPKGSRLVWTRFKLTEEVTEFTLHDSLNHSVLLAWRAFSVSTAFSDKLRTISHNFVET